MKLKLSLYADDLLLYIFDPLTTIPPILSLLERFDYFSGYKVNILKSFPINSLTLTLKQSDIPFKLMPSGFKYLGINVTCTLSSLYSANFSPLLAQVGLYFKRWNALPLTLN